MADEIDIEGVKLHPDYQLIQCMTIAWMAAMGLGRRSDADKIENYMRKRWPELNWKAYDDRNQSIPKADL